MAHAAGCTGKAPLTRCRLRWPGLALLAATALLQRTAHPADDLSAALTEGEVDLSLRWRYEHVDDDLAPGGIPLRKANVTTLRNTLGYRTGAFHGFSAYAQMEAVVPAFVDDYFDGSNGETQFATVADPGGVELNEGYLAWENSNSMVRVRGGRQEITYRPAPFHRFIGTILWRQNWQTFDAVSARLEPFEHLTAEYAYVWQVNRIFGHDAPEPLSRFEGDSHFLNLQYHGFAPLALEAYAYLLDFDNAARFSADTVGLRGSGTHAVTDTWKLLYAGEYAHQNDAGNNPGNYDADYFMGEGGINVGTGGLLRSVTLKLSYEFFGSDGTPGGAFVSALGTNHPFQGWADRFLVTPDDGLQDLYATAILDLPLNIKALISYHDFSSDRGNYDFGEELDVQITWNFMKHYQLGAKAAFYDADPGARNAVGGTASDVTKVWIWGQFRY